MLNEVIKKANLPYEVTSPSLSLISPIFDNALNDVASGTFNVQLIDPISSKEIGFANLSSGERIIASLAMLLYYTQNRGQKKNLIILDEADAHLHPTLTKQFFDVIRDVIIDKYDGKVIMSTHSASTVALAPDDSIYIMHKTVPRIEKSSKDKALKILTSGVPSFSVNYENRRQVFVESPNDVIFFERFYKFFLSVLHPEISLSFISSGESRTDKNGVKISNCEQVANITDTLRNSGNKFVWGIIDWDLKDNTGNDFVRILGNKNRYSIENYILDPLLIGALLLRQKAIKKEEVGLLENETFIDLRTFNSSRLQIISDYVVIKVLEKASPNVTGNQNCKLINGESITIPSWYLNYQGHDLEEKILQTFPKLNEIKKNKEEALKIEILEKIAEDVTGIISIDILSIFQSIQII